MHDDLSHLPAKQQAELARASKILMEEFEKATALANATWKREGRILKVILFGSYARHDWVDDPQNGYQSDFDLLVVVSHEKLTDIAEYWYIAEDKILRDEMIDRQVNIIVHDLSDVNQALKRGEYFWADIVRDGILLYELPGHPLAAPMPLSKFDAVRMAERYFIETSENIEVQLETVQFQAVRGMKHLKWRKAAAFSLHQAVEKIYACFLLTTSFYFPKSHNIKFLRSLSESKNHELSRAWPRATKLDRRRFEQLKRAYVEARYSSNYRISTEDLNELYEQSKHLRRIVIEVCEAHIAQLARP
ncbi:HEPN domain-containing protein [Novosphingobium sp. JCM 18896]|uniref:HEPN domain-containing protein n=1 Tax=Novosphingobium sp. JCM 18896 TaxID=2989731 RepID=UPI00222288CF|nr:HEPN domain-containing protein [Novosphingobium sp. JCM 18896]MCW1429355.1 HEPN domain-containing protein [Novosphingobium sp. JCM 18896]